MPEMSPKKSYIKPLLLITFIAFLLRAQNIGTMSLWLDEIWSVTNAQKGVAHILASTDPARSYPYHLVLYAFICLNSASRPPEWLVRFPSLIFGVLAVPCLYLLGKELYNRKVGLLSAFMLAFWPYHVWYSQEARMYSLFFLMSVLSTLFFAKCVKTVTWRNWVCYLLFSVLGLYTHFYFVFVTAIHTLFLIYLQLTKQATFFTSDLFYLDSEKIGARRVFLRVLLSGLLALTLYPWAQGFLEMLSVGPALNIPWGLTANDFWLETLSYLSIGYGAFFAVPLVVLVVYHVWKGAEKRNSTVLLLLWVFAPTTFLFLLTALLRPLTGNRYLIFTLPAWLILIAVGLIRFCRLLKPTLPLKKQYLLSFYFATLIFGTLAAPTIVLMPKTPREDWRDAVRFLNENVGDVELVLAYPLYVENCLNYYGLKVKYIEYYGMPSTVRQVSEDMMNVGWDGLWIVLYSWGQNKNDFETYVTKPLGFELVKSYYQIWIYHVSI